jgi:hypothetical protein
MATFLAVADRGRAVMPADFEPSSLPEQLLEKYQQLLQERGWKLQILSYEEALERCAVNPADICAVLFFPFRFWDERIEGRLPGPYGSTLYGRRLGTYLSEVGERLRGGLPGVRFLNEPEAIALTRDKFAVKQRLLSHGVPTPAEVTANTPAELGTALEKTGVIYVKAPSASMGKGIAVLSPRIWATNYVLDAGRLRSPVPGDPQFAGPDKWLMTCVEDRKEELLTALFQAPPLLLEEGIAVPLVDGSAVEIRVTVLDGQVLDLRARRRTVLAPAPTPEAPAEEADRAQRLTLSEPVGARVGQVAASALVALGLRYAVLDIVLGADWQPYVVDVQAFPASEMSWQSFLPIIDALTSPTSSTRMTDNRR